MTKLIINTVNFRKYSFLTLGLVFVLILTGCGLGDSQAKSRDSSRMIDIMSLENAVEIYYANNNEYPSEISQETVGQNIPRGVPTDPQTQEPYFYEVSAVAGTPNQTYVFKAKLEDCDKANSDNCFYEKSR